jgi:hypothetical protein
MRPPTSRSKKGPGSDPGPRIVEGAAAGQSGIQSPTRNSSCRNLKGPTTVNCAPRESSSLGQLALRLEPKLLIPSRLICTSESVRACVLMLMLPAVFLVCTSRDYHQVGAPKRSLQRFCVVPRNAHPNVPLLVGHQDYGHGPSDGSARRGRWATLS